MQKLQLNLQQSVPINIVALSTEDREWNALLMRLRKSGHLVTSFLQVASLLDILSTGHRFDILLISLFREEADWGPITSASTVLCMPILVISRAANLQSTQLPKELLQRGVLADITTPVVPDTEIDWRIRNLLRRAGSPTRNYIENHEFSLGEYHFFLSRRIVQHRERSIRLPPLQFDVALALFRNIGQVVTRTWLLSSLWGIDSPNEGRRVLDVCVAGVRKKLSLRPENGYMICPIYKSGYILFKIDSAPMSSNNLTPEGLDCEACQEDADQ
jgi:two-component system phosphate regulon response regulator PhoB